MSTGYVNHGQGFWEFYSLRDTFHQVRLLDKASLCNLDLLMRVCVFSWQNAFSWCPNDY